MRKKLLAGNWKMHMLNSELESFVSEFSSKVSTVNNIASKIDVCFGAPYTLLNNLNELVKAKGFSAAAQNCHYKDTGAFTGEISLPMLKDVGIQTVILGHSERRQYYNETDDSVAKKVTAALTAGFDVIACIGESLEERKANRTEEVLAKQVSAIITAAKSPDKLVLAYEPVWAIGTGLAATTEQAQEAHKFIRGLLVEKYGADKAEKVRILYGGSMKPENIKELISQKDIDGGLVGGASLKPDSFAQMALVAAE